MIKIEPSKTHPHNENIPLSKVPQFISIGWDDNGIADVENHGALTWLLDFIKDKKNPIGSNDPTTFDGTPLRFAFYLTAKYGEEDVYESKEEVLKKWQQLIEDEHEIGNHSSVHLMDIQPDGDDWKITNFDGREYSISDWKEKEFDRCDNLLRKTLKVTNIYGWRTPRLEWNDNILSLLEENNYLYDCSMEIAGDEEGLEFWWPHTLHNGSPLFDEVTEHNLWEIPAYKFAIPKHLQGKNKVGSKLMTGLDFNVWAPKAWGGLELTGQDMFDILKYNLDQRIKGNKAPMHIGLHSDNYSSMKNDEFPNADNRSRQKAIEDFIIYALRTYPEVRFVTPKNIIDWMSSPSSL